MQQSTGNYQQQRPQEAEWLSKNVNAAGKTLAQVPGEALAILRRPVSRVKELCDMRAYCIGWGLLAVKTLVWAIVVALMVSKVNKQLGGFYELPLLKIILITVLFTLGLDVLEAFISQLITKLFKGCISFETMINVIGERALYDTLYLLITLILIQLSPLYGGIISVILSPIVIYIQYAGYNKNVVLEEDKRPYTYFVIKAIVTIIAGWVAWMIIKSVGTSVMGEAESILSNYFDFLNYF